ncbi:MAG TPA: folate-binding protein [Candidatus Corynebacterium gallistercoris]|uniref:Folate-binding protein n=1 Tax=Candidatus Corynebacterium gallistercoris TaxID=2838530 RepID=A0A9D1RXH0_9CORY|nr:folate-binding protein [Candidatus Corynebacterium gallistercoris]
MDRHSLTAWHYGDPLVEQRRVEQRPGLVDQWDRVAIEVSGEERLTWLNNLISQKVNAIAPGQTTYGLVLDVQGRVQFFFGISCLPEAVVLDVAATHADGLERYLSSMIFWSQVEVRRLDWARLTVVGQSLLAAGSSSFVGDATAPPPLPNNLAVDLSSVPHVQMLRTHRLGSIPAVDVWVPRSEVVAVWDALAESAAPIGRMAYDALRITGRVPAMEDLDEKTIPHEVPFFLGPEGLAQGATQAGVEADGPTSAAVHLNKGCYRGQETVSRVHNLGKSPRVLVLVHLDGSANRLPELGSPVQAGSRAIGRVGTSIHDADYGPVALALVKRSVVEKLATDPAAVPALSANGVDLAIDPSDVRADSAVRPGKAAIDKLKGR